MIRSSLLFTIRVGYAAFGCWLFVALVFELTS